MSGFSFEVRISHRDATTRIFQFGVSSAQAAQRPAHRRRALHGFIYEISKTKVQAMPISQSAKFPASKSSASPGPVSRFAGQTVLLTWALLMLLAAARGPAHEPHPGNWVGIAFVEGNAAYLWFQDREACIAAMSGDASACIKADAL